MRVVSAVGSFLVSTRNVNTVVWCQRTWALAIDFRRECNMMPRIPCIHACFASALAVTNNTYISFPSVYSHGTVNWNLLWMGVHCSCSTTQANYRRDIRLFDDFITSISVRSSFGAQNITYDLCMMKWISSKALHAFSISIHLSN